MTQSWCKQAVHDMTLLVSSQQVSRRDLERFLREEEIATYQPGKINKNSTEFFQYSLPIYTKDLLGIHIYLRYYNCPKFPRSVYCGSIYHLCTWFHKEPFPYHPLILNIPRISLHTPIAIHVMETLDSTELFMEDQAWLDYLWDFGTRRINLDLPSDTDQLSHPSFCGTISRCHLSCHRQ